MERTKIKQIIFSTKCLICTKIAGNCSMIHNLQHHQPKKHNISENHIQYGSRAYFCSSFPNNLFTFYINWSPLAALSSPYNSNWTPSPRDHSSLWLHSSLEQTSKHQNQNPSALQPIRPPPQTEVLPEAKLCPVIIHRGFKHGTQLSFGLRC